MVGNKGNVYQKTRTRGMRATAKRKKMFRRSKKTAPDSFMFLASGSEIVISINCSLFWPCFCVMFVVDKVSSRGKCLPFYAES